MNPRCRLSVLGAGTLLVLLTLPARLVAQVDWSGDNWPPDGGVIEESLPSVVFFYAVYDAGRTEPEGRGEGLGAQLYFRDADDTNAAFTSIALEYIGQTGPFGPNNDLFSLEIPRPSFGDAIRVEYFTVVYDSLVNPVHADTTEHDALGNPPNFTFAFGDEIMPHAVYYHFGLCLNGSTPSSPVIVQIDPRNGSAPYEFPLVPVSAEQLPDLWEGDIFLAEGTARTIHYRYVVDGQAEEDPMGVAIVRTLTLEVGPFFQFEGHDSWENAPLGCHLTETLSQDVMVHFSVCMAGVAFSGGICIVGDVAELGSWEEGVALNNVQGPANPDLFEGDVTFPAGGPAVVQYKFQSNDCTQYEALFGGDHLITNRFFYMDSRSQTVVAPTSVWGNERPNFCGPPVGVESRTWTHVKTIYR